MKYSGQELGLFQHATSWKEYYAGLLRPYAQGDVLEVGAGIGGTTAFLLAPAVQSCTLLEPDGDLFAELQTRVGELSREHRVISICGTLDQVDADTRFNAVFYIDVLEHIPDDFGEVARASAYLKSGGHLVVLSPAFELLRSPFDDAVGHCRRYTRTSLQDRIPEGCDVVAARYLDAAGAFLSLANRWCMRRALPSAEQVRFWDRYVVPISKCIDPLFCRWWGRSVVVVARKI